jgi:hypothetical protein
MEAIYSSEKYVDFHLTRRRSNQEYGHLHCSFGYILTAILSLLFRTALFPLYFLVSLPAFLDLVAAVSDKLFQCLTPRKDLRFSDTSIHATD